MIAWRARAEHQSNSLGCSAPHLVTVQASSNRGRVKIGCSDREVEGRLMAAVVWR